jgi:hypothetical protein
VCNPVGFALFVWTSQAADLACALHFAPPLINFQLLSSAVPTSNQAAALSALLNSAWTAVPGLFAWVLCAVAITDLILNYVGLGPTDGRSLLAALIFMILVGAGVRDALRSSVVREWRGTRRKIILRDVLTAAVAFSVIDLVLARASGSALRVTLALAVFAGAMSEEIVFRAAIPDAVFGTFVRRSAAGGSSAIFGARVVTQLLFAVCHAVPLWLHGGALPLADGIRLMSAGLFYCVVRDALGLWAGIAIHAAFNLAIVVGLQSVRSSGAPSAEFAQFILATVLVWRGANASSSKTASMLWRRSLILEGSDA